MNAEYQTQTLKCFGVYLNISTVQIMWSEIKAIPKPECNLSPTICLSLCRCFFHIYLFVSGLSLLNIHEIPISFNMCAYVLTVRTTMLIELGN